MISPRPVSPKTSQQIGESPDPPAAALGRDRTGRPRERWIATGCLSATRDRLTSCPSSPHRRCPSRTPSDRRPAPSAVFRLARRLRQQDESGFAPRSAPRSRSSSVTVRSRSARSPRRSRSRRRRSPRSSTARAARLRRAGPRRARPPRLPGRGDARGQRSSTQPHPRTEWLATQLRGVPDARPRAARRRARRPRAAHRGRHREAP